VAAHETSAGAPGEFIYTRDDVLDMLDSLIEGGGGWWNGFFAGREQDQARPCPFLTGRPDESLAGWFGERRLGPGRVLELGCGYGRNAIYLAGQGCGVDAVDFSGHAIERAREQAAAAGAAVTFHCRSIFGMPVTEGSYDLVYDSGCFHHIAPHRRQDYVRLVRRALRPGGSFGLTCFRPEGGSGYTDREVYQRASLGGGLGYRADRLRALWDTPPMSLRVLRPMRTTSADEPCFGEDFLWALLATKDPA
jgi:SAM-dependent methyltransferase